MSDAWEMPPQREHVAKNNDILAPAEFVGDLEFEASRARKHVVLQSMDIEDNESGNKMIEILKSLPKNVSKTIFLDWYARLTSEGRMLELEEKVPGLSVRAKTLKGAKEKLFQRIEETGTTLRFTNRPKNWRERVFPFIGRNHIKGSDVDGHAFYLGDVNFDNLNNMGFMVKFTGDRAQKLSKMFAKIQNGHIEKDTLEPLDEYTDLYVDAGTPGESIIMKKAANLIGHAQKNVEVVSMLLPDGIIAKNLRRVTHRKESPAKVEVITTGIGKERNPMGTIYNLVSKKNRIANLLSRSGITIKETPFRDVHAKLLIIDRKYAYFGTHNLNASGVRAGTREWGIFTGDPELVENLVNQYIKCERETDPKLQQLIPSNR